MALDIKLKRSHTHSNIPTTSDLSEGEFAVNTYDRKLYMRDGSSNIVTVANHYATDFESATKVLYVTVATKDANHPYNGVGSNNGYKINGVFSPYLHLIPRNTYRFDQSDSTNANHPLRFYLDSSKTTQYTTGVTTSGTPGNSGAYTQIVVGDTTPPVLHYQCSSHANMGWAVFNNTRNLTNFDTDDLSEGSSNLYFTNARADARIAAATTDDLSEGSTTLYHTTTRVNSAIDARVTNTFINNLSGISVDTSGNAATATALATARDIHGVSFDGTGNIDLTEVIQDTVGAMFSGNTETNITATYQDSDGTIDLIASGGSTDLNSLSAGVINTANDSIAFIDADDSNNSKKETVADFLTAIAGSGITVSGNQLTASGGGGGGSGENISWSITQSSHNLAVGDVIYYNGTNYVKARADATNTLGIFVVSAVANANTFTATFGGKITLSSLTAGQYYFVSTTSAGDFTATEPTTGYSNPILFALSTTEAVVLPYRPQDLPTSSDAAQGRTLLDVFSKSETNAQISAFAIALGG